VALFIVPVVGDGLSRETRFLPKYLPALGVQWRAVYFGDKALCWANTTAEQEAAVGANADAIVVANPSSDVAVNATRNALEAMNLPGNWVQAGMTYRQVFRTLVGMALVHQRMEAAGFNLQLAGNLDKTLAQIPANRRTALAAAADSLGFDRSQVAASTTVREALRMLGVQAQIIQLGDL